ncbi:flagellar biosynthetic protein FliO [Nitratireductor sp. B36]|uniref:flagellar biosynthetic protein FliO n=1 Tax=Nitratireductor sp. B36 TaxID=2762059 RepID=UPI001E516D8A|nr:flagellar biosynthetic protein FliO [Nitratireductor sp. B36]MCC5779655.1 flagellar biosynthetic protein FliO [Nitratireductor sp. B36]
MRDWLVGIFGEAYATAAFWTIILVAVAIVLLVFVRVNRRFTTGTFISSSRGKQPRLAVMDATPVDNNRRLVLVRRDEVEHLILIGGPTDLVVETNIGRAHPEQAERKLPGSQGRPSPRDREIENVEEPDNGRDEPRPLPRSEERGTPLPERRPATPNPEIQIASRPAPAPTSAPRRYPTEAMQPVRDSVTPISSRPTVASTSTASLAAVSPSVPKREPEIEQRIENLQEADEAEAAHTREAPVVDLDVSRTERSSAPSKSSDHTLEDEMSKLLEELSEQKH